MKRNLVVLIALGLAVGVFIWLRSTPNYVNLPPSADGPWVAFGDSLTEGAGATEGNNYPAVLGRQLGIEIHNAGRSGDTTSSAMQRIEDAAGMRPRVVLLCLGGNDSLNRDSRAQLFSNLGTIIDRFHLEGSFVVLIGVRSASLRDQHGKQFRQLARQKKVLYVPDILKGLAFKPVYMSDAIHPNDAGYQRIAARVEKAIRPLLPQLHHAQQRGD